MYELQEKRVISPLDDMLPAFYFCYLLCFPLSADKKELTRDVLQTSMAALVEERPYLAGTIRSVVDGSVRKGHLVLDVPERVDDLSLVFNDLTGSASGWAQTYRDLQAAGMPPRKLDAKFLAPLTAGFGETRRVLSVQANFIDGGLLLAFCFHHNFVDAYGAGRIIARFSEHCSGTAGVANSSLSNGSIKGSTNCAPEALDFEKLKAKYRYKDLENEPRLWGLNCLAFKGLNNDFDWPDFIPSLLPARDPPVVSSLFSFTSDALKEIKAMAQPNQGNGWVSTNDALVAFLWRHVMRARFPSAATSDAAQTQQRSSVVVALDGRKDLSIPPTYIGNCLFHCFTELTISEVASRTTPLSAIASKIRKTITDTREPQLLKDVVGLAATLPDCRRIKYANDNLGPDLYTTSWTDLPFYKLDWGPIGRTDFFRIPDRQFETLCCILPSRNGIVEVITSMEQPHSLRLASDVEFTRFAKFT